MIFVSLVAGAITVAQTGTSLRVDPALQRAFGLPGHADQSVLAETLTAATDQDVVEDVRALDRTPVTATMAPRERGRQAAG